MSLTIKRFGEEEVWGMNYDLDPHTVSLKDHGTWWVLKNGSIPVSFLCIRPQHGELYIGEVFTPKEYRGNGYFSTLLDYVANTIYAGYSISTHALITSKAGFEACGFKQYRYREFKYGNQYWLRRNGLKLKDIGGENDCKKV